MQGKTHLVVGTAVTMAVLHPDNVPELIGGTAIAALGTLICDVDSDSSESNQKGSIAVGIGFIALLLLMLIEHKWNMGITDFLLNNSNIIRFIIGLVLFLVVCIFGKLHAHRTFMHSFLAGVILTGCLYIMFPTTIKYFIVAFISHLVLDVVNKKGEQLFYPLKIKVGLGLCSADGAFNKLLFGIGNIGLIVVYAVLIIRIVVKFVAS